MSTTGRAPRGGPGARPGRRASGATVLTASTRRSSSGRSSASVRQRARAEVAGVVDEQVEARADGRGEGGAVLPGRRRRRATAVTRSGWRQRGDGGRPAGRRRGRRGRAASRGRSRAVARARPRPREAPVTSAVAGASWDYRRTSSGLEVKGCERGLLAIGEVAGRSGMAPSALRYYEDQGLIERHPDRGRRPAVPAERAAPAGADPGGAQRGAVAAGDPGGAGHPAGGPAADGDRLGPALQRSGGTGWTSRSRRSTQLRDGLTSCIGCGCLSLDRCALSNPGRRGGRSTDPGARWLAPALRRTPPG